VNRPRDPCYGPSVAGVADEQAPSPQEAPSRPPVRRALLVEDDPHLRRTLARSLRAWGVEVVEAGTASEARTALAMRFDLVLCDVRLPDGSGLVVVRQAGELRPAPVVIAMSGAASASEGWDIARAGAQAFLEKPVSPEALERAVSAALESPPQLEPLVAACVGLRPLRDLQSEVRTVMIEQALALSRGNQSEAARLLQITRQAIQQAVAARRPRAVDEDRAPVDLGAASVGDPSSPANLDRDDSTPPPPSGPRLTGDQRDGDDALPGAGAGERG